MNMTQLFGKTGLAILCAGLVLSGLGCGVEPFLLASERTDTYTFTNEALSLPESMYIDESLVHEIKLSSQADGVETAEIYGLYLGEITQVANSQVIYYLHGNATGLNHYWDHIVRLANVGGKHAYSIFAIDYRGFGKSEGTLTTDGWIADVNAGLKWLQDQGLPESQLHVYAYSLGGMAGAMAATQSDSLQVQRLIMDSPFPGPSPLLHASTGLSIDGALISDIGDFDVIGAMGAYTGRLFWFHTLDDTTVPIEYGQAMYDACTCPKEFSNPATGDHEPYLGLGQSQYAAIIDQFFTGQ